MSSPTADRTLAARLQQLAPLPFLAFAVIFVVGAAIAVPTAGRTIGIMAAFDAAALGYLGGVAPLLRRTSEQIREYAVRNDANRPLLLLVTATLSLVVLLAVSTEMRSDRHTVGVAFSLATLMTSWLFANVVYALHYAHMFYMEPDEAAQETLVSFPKTRTPGYRDFAYFSFTLGMTFQTSDVEIRSTKLRRVVLGHCLIAFVFNIGVLALTISLLGGAIA